MTNSSLGVKDTLLVRTAQWFLGGLLMLALTASHSLMAARFVDAMVAQVELYTIAASDIALARALGLYGLPPGKGPIRTEDVDRFIDGRLIVAEAERLGIVPSAEALEQAWREVVARGGGRKRFRAWLAENGIAQDWARRLTNSDAQRRHFTEIRFERFVFIPEEEITKALGTAAGEDERERVREALRKKRAERELARWLEEQRKRTSIRRFTDGEIPDPLDADTSDTSAS